jgi:hypothetical protein
VLQTQTGNQIELEKVLTEVGRSGNGQGIEFVSFFRTDGQTVAMLFQGSHGGD